MAGKGRRSTDGPRRPKAMRELGPRAAVDLKKSKVWSVVDAKAKLSEILRLAREGRPQAIGADDPCMVVSASEFERYWRPDHLGKFLIESAPRGIEFELPSRADDRTGDIFAPDGERAA
jgi:hypothetical protein